MDPRCRGRRLDEHLDTVRALLAGQELSADTEFLSIPAAIIHPVPEPPVPILIGGRSAAALRRTGRAADGWIAIWVSPNRAQQALSTIAEHAEHYGRERAPDRNALMVLCGLGDSAAHGRSLVAPVMEDLYKTLFERFERYTPCGTPAEVAEAIAPFVDLGFHDITLNGVAEDAGTLIALSDEVGRVLAAG